MLYECSVVVHWRMCGGEQRYDCKAPSTEMLLCICRKYVVDEKIVFRQEAENFTEVSLRYIVKCGGKRSRERPPFRKKRVDSCRFVVNPCCYVYT